MTTVAQRGLAPARAVLPNGTVVIAKQSPATPAVTIHASVRAGSEFDPLDLAGVSHFVSKTIDRGTTSRVAARIADEFEDRGVSLAITINRHAMWLICTCLVEDLDAILELLADVITDAVFPGDEIETKRGEITTLIRQDEDSPAIVAAEGLMADLYGASHPYGRRPRGSVETVEKIDGIALRAFYGERFRPASLSLVLVGDIEARRAIDAAARAFGNWQGTAPAASTLREGPPARARRVRVVPMMNKAQVDIAYGFTSLRRSDPEYYAYWLMNNILGQYAIGGRLGDRIRERDGMAYYALGSLDANIIPGPLMIRAGVSPENVDRAVAAIDEELVRFATDGPTAKELAESRQYLIGSMPRTLETNLGIANYLQTEEFFGLGLDYDLRVPELLGGVTPDAVIAAARRTLVPSRATIVIAGPYAGQGK